MTSPERKRATLYDVAEAAGVSAQTVSRVVNNLDRVAPKTRSRVLRAMQELDYQPNLAAQRLKTQRSFTLQVFVFHESYPTPFNGILGRAKALGYKALFDLLNPTALDELRAALDDAHRLLIDGVILIGPPNLPVAELEKMARGTPIIQLGAPAGIQVASVVTDQMMGGRLAAQHLIDLGHGLIAEISGPIETNDDARQRHEAFVQTLHAAGIQPVGSIVGGYGGFSHQGGYHAAHELVARGDPFTALVAGNDNLAIGAIKALHEHGLRVPDDVSVIGFDDTSWTAYTIPALTTIRQDFETMGAQAVEYLIGLIESRPASVHQRVLYPELVVRESTRRVSDMT